MRRLTGARFAAAALARPLAAAFGAPERPAAVMRVPTASRPGCLNTTTARVPDVTFSARSAFAWACRCEVAAVAGVAATATTPTDARVAARTAGM